MIKLLVALVIALVAGIIGFNLREGECRDGTVIADQASCLRTGRSAQACAGILAEAETIARRTGPNFPTRFACNDRFPDCIERSDVTGWTARPKSYCLTMRSGALDITPIYSTRP